MAPSVNALPDTFYDDLGTELSTVVPITSGVTDAGTSTLAGTNSLAGSIFYFLGNLTIAAGTTINIDNNAELRIRGFLTINVASIDCLIESIDDGLDPNNNPSNRYTQLP